jgi:hypothetical protein
VVQGSVFGINVSGSDGIRASLLTPTIQGPELWTGGQFGIEASLITVIIWLLITGAMLVLVARRGRIMTPAWVHRLLKDGHHVEKSRLQGKTSI